MNPRHSLNVILEGFQKRATQAGISDEDVIKVFKYADENGLFSKTLEKAAISPAFLSRAIQNTMSKGVQGINRVANWIKPQTFDRMGGAMERHFQGVAAQTPANFARGYRGAMNRDLDSGVMAPLQFASDFQHGMAKGTTPFTNNLRDTYGQGMGKGTGLASTLPQSQAPANAGRIGIANPMKPPAPQSMAPKPVSPVPPTPTAKPIGGAGDLNKLAPKPSNAFNPSKGMGSGVGAGGTKLL